MAGMKRAAGCAGLLDAADALARDGYLLPEDAWRIAERAAASAW